MKRIFLLSVAFLLPWLGAQAQNTVTFQLNLKPQLEDSLFIPGRDRVYLAGDQYPLSPGRKVTLRDLAPIDSVFSAEITFSSTVKGRTLVYGFFLVIDEETRGEYRPRSMVIPGSNLELDALYFDSFAW